MKDHSGDGLLAGRYEAAFSVFMAGAAFLWRGDAKALGDANLLALFAGLMVVNLAATRALRAWSARRAVSAAICLLNCGVVAAIVERSGGGESLFWVLYLLPIYSACLLLGARETALITGGALCLNFASSAPEAGVWSADVLMSLAVKSAVMVLASSVTLRLAERERGSRARLRRDAEAVLELERQVRAQRERLEDAADAAEQDGLVNAGLAHDLNNALTVILGFADVALQRSGGTEASQELAGIRRSADLAKQLAAGLLASSRRTRTPAEILDLEALLRETLGLLRQQAERAGVALELDAAPGAVSVRARRAQLERIFLNLAGNAVGALRERGGRVRVSLRAERRGSAQQAVVVVEDDGPGLPTPVLERLFQPYVSGGRPDGHGLGLYICWELARDNGGRLHGGNKPEGGARFELFLPAVEAAQAQARETEEARPCAA